ncbi:MAG: cysteine-rich small domain-containing protein [Synergistes sp.]|nr:cysteine-rich small domain-containing protein [Synergistes sp.]
MSGNYKFFSHRECEYFPCHDGVPEDEFNCLFCYCPLYLLGPECGGNFVYTEKGVKNCVNCCRPHVKDNYSVIVDKLREVLNKSKKSCSEGSESLYKTPQNHV